MSVIAFNQHQHRFRFVKAGEVPEVTVLTIGVFAVGATCYFWCSKNQRGAAGLHLLYQGLTATLKFLPGYITHNTLLTFFVFSVESVFVLLAQSVADE